MPISHGGSMVFLKIPMVSHDFPRESPHFMWIPEFWDQRKWKGFQDDSLESQSFQILVFRNMYPQIIDA